MAGRKNVTRPNQDGAAPPGGKLGIDIITMSGELTCRSPRTPRRPGEYSLPKKERWSKFAKSVACTITTSAAPPNARFRRTGPSSDGTRAAK